MVLLYNAETYDKTILLELIKTKDKVEFKGLDSSLKKNSGFSKKLKQLTNRNEVLSSIQTLSLSMYLQEIIQTINSMSINSKQLYLIVEIVVLLYLRFRNEFYSPVYSTLKSTLDKQKLKVLIELIEFKLSSINDVINSFRQLVTSVETISTVTQLLKFKPSLLENAVLKQISVGFYESCSSHFIQLHITLHKKRERLKEHQIIRGDNQEMEEDVKQISDSYEKLKTNLEQLSQLLSVQFPELPVLETKAAQTVNIQLVTNSLTVENIWEDEEQQAFYTKLPELHSVVPASLLKESKKVTKVSLEDLMNDDDIVDKDTEDDPPPSSISTGYHEKLTALLEKLPETYNKELIDQLATDFVYLNSKSARQRLLETLSFIPKARIDLAPFFARFAAILHPYFPRLTQGLLKKLIASFKGQMFGSGQLEIRLVTIRYLAELLLFNVAPTHVAFYILTQLVYGDFKGNDVDICCSFLEVCGRWLMGTPETMPKTAELLDVVMKKKKSMIDSREKLLVENAYLACHPTQQNKVNVVEIDPKEAYILYLLHTSTSNGKNAKDVVKQLLKFNWEQESDMIMRIFQSVKRLQWDELPFIAKVVYELDKHIPYVGVFIADYLLESSIVLLELNQPSDNQIRLFIASYVAYLYEERLIQNGTLFKFMEKILFYGYDASPNLFDASAIDSRLDNPSNHFRVHLICSIILPIGVYLARHASKMTRLLDIFHHYIYTKEAVGIELRHKVIDAFASCGIDYNNRNYAGVKMRLSNYFVNFNPFDVIVTLVEEENKDPTPEIATIQEEEETDSEDERELERALKQLSIDTETSKKVDVAIPIQLLDIGAKKDTRNEGKKLLMRKGNKYVMKDLTG